MSIARRVDARIAALLGVCTLLLGGCMTEGQHSLNAAAPRGATIAFESIDGPPPDVFRKLVDDLNDEAQTRRLAVVSRETNDAVYRARGYLAVHVVRTKASKHAKHIKPGKTAVSWVWDIYDAEQNRALRISGEEDIGQTKRDGSWDVADDALVRKIARASIDQIAAFLTSPSIAPGGAPAGIALESGSAGPTVALATTRD
ncbi:MAG: hypothetical protein JO237_06725 [Pseudolabrys sp.]|nr:hypothetical protein [Pseudolabrys sp.]